MVFRMRFLFRRSVDLAASSCVWNCPSAEIRRASSFSEHRVLAPDWSPKPGLGIGFLIFVLWLILHHRSYMDKCCSSLWIAVFQCLMLTIMWCLYSCIYGGISKKLDQFFAARLAKLHRFESSHLQWCAQPIQELVCFSCPALVLTFVFRKITY